MAASKTPDVQDQGPKAPDGTAHDPHDPRVLDVPVKDLPRLGERRARRS